MPPSRQIPAKLRRRLLYEAEYRCAICNATTIEVHHIIPWNECKRHDYENLIVLCRNHHQQAHEGTVDKIALRQYKSRLINSKLHEVATILLSPNDLFSSEWGPEGYPSEEKDKMILNLKSREMLGGVIITLNWALVRCDICRNLVSMDKAWTLQDNCMLDSDERLEVYCDFGCSEKYQQMMREKYPNNYTDYDYYLQNFVKILRITMQQMQSDDVEA